MGNNKKSERFHSFLQNSQDLLLPQNCHIFSEITQEILNDFDLIGLIEDVDIVAQSEDIFVQLSLDIIESLTDVENIEILEEKMYFLGELNSMRGEDTVRGVLDRLLLSKNKNMIEHNPLTGRDVVKIPPIVEGVKKISFAFKKVANEIGKKELLAEDSYSSRLMKSVSKKCMQNAEHFDRIIQVCEPKR